MQTTLNRDQAMLDAIQDWKYWDEIQIGAEKEYGMPKDEFDKLLPEYWKFMGLIAQGFTGLGMFSNAVDTIWHAHILNTPRYEKFCMAIFGRMIHHVPNLHIGGFDIRSFAPDCTEPGPSCREPEPDPSCREPEPDPSCREFDVPATGKGNAKEYFRNAYLLVYGELPGNIWSLPESDGSAMIK
jgi:hypothetical protein